MILFLILLQMVIIFKYSMFLGSLSKESEIVVANQRLIVGKIIADDLGRKTPLYFVYLALIWIGITIPELYDVMLGKLRDPFLIIVISLVCIGYEVSNRRLLASVRQDDEIPEILGKRIRLPIRVLNISTLVTLVIAALIVFWSQIENFSI